MPTRVAILGLYHETNTFITDLLSIKNVNQFKGGEIRKAFETAHHEIGGMYEVFDEEGVEVVDVFFADATPGGRVETHTYDFLLNKLLQGLKSSLPVDGVMLVAHGAAAGEDIDDIDADWFMKVREMVGYALPLVATLDPHANVSKEMVAATNAMLAYKTNPHVDQRATGKKAAQVMIDILKGNVKPVQYFVELPLSISIEQQCTYLEPCKTMYDIAYGLSGDAGIIDINILLGFPYADVKKMGSSLLVVADKDNKQAAIVAKKLQSHIIEHLPVFSGKKKTLADAIKEAECNAKPVLFLDMGDNIGGGSPGNSTSLLRLLEAAGRFRSFICIHDPAIVKQAQQYQVGSAFDITINEFQNKTDNYTCTVSLIRTSDGKFTETKVVHGGKTEFDMGNIAVVKTIADTVILFTTLRMPPFSLNQLLQFGIQPNHFDVIIAKGVNAPLAAYSDVCKHIVQVDTPGVTQADATRFTYKNRVKPKFPFESIDECYAATI